MCFFKMSRNKVKHWICSYASLIRLICYFNNKKCQKKWKHSQSFLSSHLTFFDLCTPLRCNNEVLFIEIEGAANARQEVHLHKCLYTYMNFSWIDKWWFEILFFRIRELNINCISTFCGEPLNCLTVLYHYTLPTCIQ